MHKNFEHKYLIRCSLSLGKAFAFNVARVEKVTPQTVIGC